METVRVQDVLYQPVGLACGHRFCKLCALEAAGKGMWLGKLKNILKEVDAQAQCPQCRQPGVYKKAIILKETDRLVQQRQVVKVLCVPRMSCGRMLSAPASYNGSMDVIGLK